MPTSSTLISVRLSAEALAAIDAAPGKNRTDKLEALVLLRSLELPATLAEGLATLAERLEAGPGRHRPHRRPPARRHFRRNHQSSGTEFV